MQLTKETFDLLDRIENELEPIFKKISRIALQNQQSMLDAFQAERIGTHHFQTTTGYGYCDLGRDALERVFARVFKAESALVRQQLVSGTHAIACAVLGNLTPQDELLIGSGFPYETLMGVLGLDADKLETISATAGFKVRVVPLLSDGSINLSALTAAINERTKMVLFQRSCGYSERPSLSLDRLEPAFTALKRKNPTAAIFVDNCYGEFVETKEPLEIGADLIAGSLIKNPGGCLIPSGGYIVGRKRLVEKAAERLYVPRIGGAIGPSLVNLQLFFQGFFEAPHRVGEMVKGAALAAKLFESVGLKVAPLPDAIRTDIIQKIYFNKADALIAFCQAVQKNSPVESDVLPIPAEMPGYVHHVIMGGGTFISGATSEFSADAPITPPYIAFLQGGLSYTQIKLSLAGILQSCYQSSTR
ncbi:MAG TPA: aluminum resistance family protein [Firmicutes bacterium]|jgi:cystathionine beta-lyase family protein involved in aluminum resistance|nr:aluminum resistance family protein [Bacillota bacterium]